MTPYSRGRAFFNRPSSGRQGSVYLPISRIRLDVHRANDRCKPPLLFPVQVSRNDADQSVTVRFVWQDLWTNRFFPFIVETLQDYQCVSMQ